jgi:hypothetical protein
MSTELGLRFYLFYNIAVGADRTIVGDRFCYLLLLFHQKNLNILAIADSALDFVRDRLRSENI